MSADVRDTLIARGWRQGSLIIVAPNDDFKKFAHCDLTDDDVFLVVSQTCDLVNPNFDIEPFFEVLRLTVIEIAPKTEYLGGKNSRQLHFQEQLAGKVTTFCALPFERFFVDRQLLMTISPDGALSDDIRDTVSVWLSKRFVRTAFPDSFDKRWKGRIKQIERVIKKLKFVKDIYIKISPFGELDDAEDYIVEITLLMDNDFYSDSSIYAQYDEYKKELDDQFSQCKGIDLQVVELRSDADITLRELEALSRWDYSYLSFRDPGEHVEPSSIV